SKLGQKGVSTLAAGAPHNAADVKVGHFSRHGLLRLINGAEPFEALVRHLDNRYVRLGAGRAVAADLGVSPGQDVEDGRLTGAGRAQNSDLQGPLQKARARLSREPPYMPGCCGSCEKRSRAPWHFGQRSGGYSPRACSPQTWQIQCSAISRTMSPRLTIPTSSWPAMTGTRLMRRSISRKRTSSTSVSSLTLMMPGDMISRAVGPRLASMSYSLTSPMTVPLSSVIGTALMRCLAS